MNFDTKKCPTTGELELYTLREDSKKDKALGKHINSCSLCRFVLSQLEKENAQLETAWNKISESRTIILLPMSITTPGLRPAPVRLAAKGRGEGKGAPLSEVLSSPDKLTQIRAVLDPRSGETWLYLTTRDQTPPPPALVKPFGLSREYFTDSQGRINLGEIAWPKPENLKVEVKLPNATFLLKQVESAETHDKSVELVSEQGDVVSVSLSGTASTRRLTVRIVRLAGEMSIDSVRIGIRGVSKVDGESVISSGDQLAVFENIDISKELEIFIFH